MFSEHQKLEQQCQHTFHSLETSNVPSKRYDQS